jgi:hypothetical protein
MCIIFNIILMENSFKIEREIIYFIPSAFLSFFMPSTALARSLVHELKQLIKLWLIHFRIQGLNQVTQESKLWNCYTWKLL